MLGGAAVHFSLAASFFDEVHVVGPVGEDFGEAELAVLARPRRATSRTSSASPAARRSSGAGEYGWDLNSRQTIDTQLGVFERLRAQALGARRAPATCCSWPTSSPTCSCEVREQCDGARFVALDSMNLWIDIARDCARAGDRDRRLRDAQRRRAAHADGQAEPRLSGRARGDRAGGPGRGRGQAGRVRRGADHARRLLRAAGLSAGDRARPDRRRRHVRRAASSATIAAAAQDASSHDELLRSAMATAPRWRRSTSKSSAPSASRACSTRRSTRACASWARSPASAGPAARARVDRPALSPHAGSLDHQRTSRNDGGERAHGHAPRRLRSLRGLVGTIPETDLGRPIGRDQTA